MKKVAELLNLETSKKEISEDEVVAALGNSIAALHSVPTSIYCYLKAQNEIAGIEVAYTEINTILY